METPNQKYKANDYDRLFRDLGFPEGYDMFRGIEDIGTWPPPHPSVPTHCFYSTGVPTPEISSTVRIFLRSLNRWQSTEKRETDR